MSLPRRTVAAASFILGNIFCSALLAATWTVSSSDELSQRLMAVSAGDVVIMQPRRYVGNFSINQSITLRGMVGATIDAAGAGSAITISASRVTIEGLRLENWGGDLYETNAGILILPKTHDITLSHNQLQGDGFGIRADHSQGIEIKHNHIAGNSKLHVLDRGDGIHLNRVKSASIDANHIEHVRDGVYIESSHISLVTHNRFYHQQYGIHYMYSEQDEAFGNFASDVYGGYAIMSSKDVYLHHNWAQHASDFGVLLNITNGARIEGNVVKDIHNPEGEEALSNQGKGLFIYGALDNEIRGNEFANSDIGISMAMGGEKNRIYENNLIDNLIQVKYVGDRLLGWSHQGRGNYWSGYLGWDSNQTGTGDNGYQPNDAMDKLFWLYPEAKFLLNSPVVSLLRWVESQLSIVTPTGIFDPHPLIQPMSVLTRTEFNLSESELAYGQ